MTIHRTLRLPLLVLLLLATLAISGTGEQTVSSKPDADATQASEEKTEASAEELSPPAPASRHSKLNLARLDRSVPEPAVIDIFASKSWVPPPPPPPPQRPLVVVPAAPVAPPLPFTYAGQLAYPDGKLIVYLTKGKTVYTAVTGDIVDSNYRLESAGDGQLVFTYLPLKTRQTLVLPVK